MVGSVLITLFVLAPIVVLSRLLAHSRGKEMAVVRVASTYRRRLRRRF